MIEIKEIDGIEDNNLSEDEIIDTLTTYFRRSTRGRIVDLPRWAQ